MSDDLQRRWGDDADFAVLDRRYVQRDSEEYQEIVRGMRDLSEIKDSAWRMERYLVGGLDHNGKYTMGLLSWIKGSVILGGVVFTVFLAVVGGLASQSWFHR